jgi:hypothetical protein
MKKVLIIFITLISFIRIATAQNPQWLNYTYGNTVSAILEDVNILWIGTGGGLVEFDKTTETLTFYNATNSGLPDNWVNSIAIDGSGTKWIGTGIVNPHSGGLAKFDGTNWTTYNTSNSGLPNNWVRSIAIDGNGTKWIGTDGGGLTKFDGTNWTTYNTSNSGLPDNHVNSVAIDENGTKWIGNMYGGLAAFNENGIPTSISGNILTSNNFKVFPNPAFNTITIETPAKGFLSILTLNGQQLLQQEITESKTTFDISILASGVYFVKLVGVKGVQVGKFIKR